MSSSEGRNNPVVFSMLPAYQSLAGPRNGRAQPAALVRGPRQCDAGAHKNLRRRSSVRRRVPRGGIEYSGTLSWPQPSVGRLVLRRRGHVATGGCVPRQARFGLYAANATHYAASGMIGAVFLFVTWLCFAGIVAPLGSTVSAVLCESRPESG